VTITGTGFTGATAVSFGGTAVTSFSVVSDSQITTTSPAGSAGSVAVTVTTPRGTSALVAADQFTYAAPTPAAPAVTGLSPTTGSTSGGTPVTITGTGFTGATAVSFGGTAVTSFSVVSDGQITTTSPAGSAGSVAVTVTTPRGTSALVAADQFTYAAPTSTIGLYDPSNSTFLLRNTNDSGFADEVYCYGAADADMVPIVGDWIGNGVQSIGLYDQSTSTFYLRSVSVLQGADDQGYADTAFVFGPAHSHDLPVVGDWNGDGKDSVGLYDPGTSTFYLRNTDSLQGPNDHGYADIVFNYGARHSKMLPVIGDWDGSGRDGIGLYNQGTSTFYLRETTQLQGSSDHGYADVVFNYGAPHQKLLPIAGDWNGDGRDGIGLYDQSASMFLLRNSIQLEGPNDHGYADITLLYGSAHGSDLPIAGTWTAASALAAAPSASDSGGALTDALVGCTTTDSVRYNVPMEQSLTTVTGGNGSLTQQTGTGKVQVAQPVTGELSGGILQSQLPLVNPKALDQIDPSTVAGSIVGSESLDSVADGLVGGRLEIGI
jgi:hypothetical protein